MSAEDRVQLASAGHDLLFTHAALWGCGAVAAAARPAVRLGWEGRLSRTPVLYGMSGIELARLLHDRARDAEMTSHWLRAGLPHELGRALFSPRVKTLPDRAAWAAWQQARRGHVDRLAVAAATLDMRLAAGLGEPSSWHHHNGQPRQDHGASRLEMQPRNQGSEFVGTRMRSLAAAVGQRTAQQVLDGLTGLTSVDEAGGDRSDSRSAANLMPPRPTDNALAWAAMWGLATTTVVHRVHQPSRTATHVPWSKDSGAGSEVRAGHLVAPLWRGRWSWARLATVLSSAQLAQVAGVVLAGEPAAAADDATWLRERGVTGLLVVPVHTYGSTSSPERRAMAGQVTSLMREGS